MILYLQPVKLARANFRGAGRRAKKGRSVAAPASFTNASIRDYYLARTNFQGCWFIGFGYQPSHLLRSIMFCVT